MAVCLKSPIGNLSNTEVGDLINSIYGPNATTQLLAGKDIDTHYEFRPNRGVRYRYRVNGTACLVDGHDAIQITLRTIPTTPPKLSTMNLPHNSSGCHSTPRRHCIYYRSHGFREIHFVGIHYS